MWLSKDLAYFAGLLDGEGTFTIVARKRESRKRPWHRGTKRFGSGIQLIPQAAFGIQSKELVEWAKEHFGGLTYSRNSREMYEWRLCQFENLRDFISQVAPYLKLKRKQALLIKKFVEYRLQFKDDRYHNPYDEKCFELANAVRALNGNKKAI